MDEYKLTLKRLTFTVDPINQVKYENLKYLKELTNLKIYYSAQNNPVNLGKIINTVASLKNVETIFVEYLEKNRIFNEDDLKYVEERSFYYKNVICSNDKYLEVLPIDFKVIRQNMNFNALE